MRVVFLLATAAFAAYAESSISGRVIDPSGSAVPGARITAVERSSTTQFNAKSASDGTYTLEHLSPGVYLIEAQASQFGASQVESVELPSDSSQTAADLRLDLRHVSTQVQVTAVAGAQTVDEQAKALDIIDLQQISDREEYSIAEAVRNTPGLRVQQLGGPGAFVRILSRGMRAYDTAILLDGFRLRDAASPQGEASSLISDLLIGDTDRIEILRGSGSSLYGTHATGGVINLITSTGDTGFHGEIAGEGGGLGFLRGSVKAGGSAYGQRMRYSVAGTHLNVLDGVDGNDRTRNTVGHGSVQYKLTDRTDLVGRILTNDGFVQLNSTPSAVSGLSTQNTYTAQPFVNFTPSPDDPDSRRTSNYFSGLIAATQTWSPSVISRISYNAVRTRRDNRNGAAGSGFQPSFNTSDIFEGDLDTIQARTDFNLPFNLITAGYEWEREGFNSLSRDENPDPAERANARLRIHQNSHAVFAQDQVKLLQNRLQISLSGRVQHFLLAQPTFSDGTSVYRNVKLTTPPNAYTGDASFAYFLPSTSTKLRGHIGNGYRAPSLYERFGGSFFGGFSVYGDPLLQPDRLLAFDVGFDQYVGSRVRVSSTYFYTRIQKAIIFDFSGAIVPATDPYGRFGGYRNSDGGLARGVELSMEAKPTRNLSVLAAYTFTNADERRPFFATGTLRSPRVSDHMFTVTATQRIKRSFDVTLDLFKASDYLMSLSSRTFSFRGPLKSDLAFNYTRALTDATSLRFFTRIDNFLNRTYFEEGFRTPGVWATGGVRLIF